MSRNVLNGLQLIGLTVLTAGLLAACATVGGEFDSSNVSEIRTGQTTKSDVFNMFGRPTMKGLEDGQVTWTYVDYQYRPNLFGGSKGRELKVTFDKNDRVVSYSYNTNMPNEVIAEDPL